MLHQLSFPYPGSRCMAKLIIPETPGQETQQLILLPFKGPLVFQWIFLDNSIFEFANPWRDGRFGLEKIISEVEFLLSYKVGCFESQATYGRWLNIMNLAWKQTTIESKRMQKPWYKLGSPFPAIVANDGKWKFTEIPIKHSNHDGITPGFSVVYDLSHQLWRGVGCWLLVSTICSSLKEPPIIAIKDWTTIKKQEVKFRVDQLKIWLSLTQPHVFFLDACLINASPYQSAVNMYKPGGDDVSGSKKALIGKSN